jgi:hypothetical protein
LALLVFTCALFVKLPSAQAYDSAKIVLPAVSDRSGYNSSELNAALLNKLRSQFRFPGYETILTSAMTMAPDRSAFEKITADKGADGAVAVEINYLRTQMYNGFFDDETYEDTYLKLTLTYFDKKTGQYGQFKTNRSAREISSVYSGPLPLAMNAMEELLNRLDKIFPRQFSGPRY